VQSVEITAGRLHLRPWAPTDADAVLLGCSDPLTQRWTSVPSPYTHADAVAWVERVAPDGWDRGTTASWAVVGSLTDEVLASVGLSGLDGPGGPSVGYWCLPAARSLGVVSEAVGAACRWGFGALGLPRIGWTAEVGNVASRAVAERQGFTVEGVARSALLHRGARVDAWTGGLLATDEVVDRRSLPAPPVLSDDVVTLRGWTLADAPGVAACADDPEVLRWLPGPEKYGRDGGCFYVDELVPTRWAEGSMAGLAVTVDGRVAGGVVLLLGRRDVGVAEVGWWTSPWARGRGVASRAADLVTQWAFSLGIARVEAHVEPRNESSRRVALRAGFALEGVARGAVPALSGSGRSDLAVYARMSSS